MADKLRVMFVDDELHILRGLRRSMAEMDDEWEMSFCQSGKEALALMAVDAYDVLVTDMRMPGMDGAQLLDRVRSLHPGTVRVVLSGYADVEVVLRTVGASHSYLAKPCTLAALREAIGRQIGLRRLLKDTGLRIALAGLSSLPSLPDTCVRLEGELTSPTASPKSVAAVIDEDIAMSAQILKLTNSSYFAVNGRVSTPLQAVRILGLEVIHALALQLGLFRQFRGGAAAAPLIRALSSHALTVARIAEAIAAAEGADSGLAKAAYCAALLSNIGCLVLLDSRTEDYLAVLAAAAEGRLGQAEEEAFGADHSAIGAYLLGLWGFTDPVIEAVAYARRPGDCAGHDNLVLTAVHAALALGPRLPLLPAGHRDVPALDRDYLRAAGHLDNVDRWCELAVRHAQSEG